ncbi:MAG: ATP-binding protein [Rhodocyclaceae bacterium]|jgi:predicted AAA+ superfamily ATPase|nr:ATP-binding protein [Rhodocyclaceae bacterium]
MKRYLDATIATDLDQKLVILTGPRQVGKTTLARRLMETRTPAQYLNWDVAADRRILQQGSWRHDTRLLVMDEIHKMPGWKAWLKGVVDGRSPEQALLVTGSARMETFRQSGESLAGRYFSWHLHPVSVREWCAHAGVAPAAALHHLMQRGGFPEPCLAPTDESAERWRMQYATDLVREDILEFSRLHEVTVMRLFLDLLRERVGTPLSLASLARDLAVAPATLKRYLDILQALFIVFAVHPWHRNIGRAILQTPKIYFFDTGMVRGDNGARFENAVAAMLLKHSQYHRDAGGKDAALHYIRTKDGAEVDFALSENGELTQLIECKYADGSLHRPLARFAEQFPHAQAVQLVAELRQEEQRGRVAIRHAGDWLAGLAA